MTTSHEAAEISSLSVQIFDSSSAQERQLLISDLHQTSRLASPGVDLLELLVLFVQNRFVNHLAQRPDSLLVQQALGLTELE
jgi:hypothetical protein